MRGCNACPSCLWYVSMLMFLSFARQLVLEEENQAGCKIEEYVHEARRPNRLCARRNTGRHPMLLRVVARILRTSPAQPSQGTVPLVAY